MKVTRKAAFKLGKTMIHATTLVEDGNGYRLHIQHSPKGDRVSFFQDGIDGLRMLTNDNKKFYDATMHASIHNKQTRGV